MFPIRFPVPTLLCFAAVTCATAQEPAVAFNTQVKKLMDAHCMDCHGEDVQKAGLRLDTLPMDFADLKTSNTWVHVLDKISSGEMPPKKQERPPQQDVTTAVNYLR
ncbi:MAG TPA: c-type cytochrome domain-containing protein, partial [Candidatus Saccharimonadia bacterium]|nr:c-type cytochrome domain-containing protein [Candidatus Saccharimonadia bacterium]